MWRWLSINTLDGPSETFLKVHGTCEERVHGQGHWRWSLRNVDDVVADPPTGCRGWNPGFLYQSGFEFEKLLEKVTNQIWR